MQIRTGEIVHMKMYDVADEIRLDTLPPDVFAGRLPVRQSLVRVETKSIELVNPPVAVDLGPRAWVTSSGRIVFDLSAHFFDVGVVCLIMRVPVRNLELSAFTETALSMDPDPEIDRMLDWEIEQIIHGIGACLTRQHGFADFQEEYTFYILKDTDEPVSFDTFRNYPTLLSMLLGERAPVSRQQTDMMADNAFSFSDDELVLLNYDNALIVDRKEAADILLLLEYAVVQVLEARYYDETLTAKLQGLYRDMDTPMPFLTALFSSRWSNLARRGMKLILETRLMTDHLTTSVRVTEDVYYAQIYTRALRIFRTQTWLAKIDEKLGSMKDAYELMENEIDSKRSTVLEWIVIVLIAMELVRL